MYRVGRKAHAHSNYVRPNYTDVWKHAKHMAEVNQVSLSEFINHALYVFMTGTAPDDGKLEGDEVTEIVRKDGPPSRARKRHVSHVGKQQPRRQSRVVSRVRYASVAPD